ncbi:GATA zinc finger domain-containing protein 14 isoform X2 [Drosophila gunungcola]|uniref:GATA zinc finger domain-containing protein 14 isoform X2 n=1 Tax=Drosophila gunungcola TaxID=103775 RepID=UPI0022E93043|nr:GATA zinc finger domain-containing protein 14 isoform X2 [Drosophila gunungcola]
MARRSNFIEGNDNFREQNLRFVRNEFEDNINQFFGGANPGGSGQQKPPPRDSLIVQPTAGNNEMDNRRQFLRELGASRMLANALAQRTFKVPNFNLRHFQRQRFRLSVELGDSRQDVVDKEVLRAIGEAVESQDMAESRPRTPSPPRNIDWHTINRDSSPGRIDRSRPRNRQREDNFQGRRDNSRGFAVQRNSGPNNAPINRNQDVNRNNRSVNTEEAIHRNSGPINVPINRNNRSMNTEEPNRNANHQELNRNKRSDAFIHNNRSTNQPEFNRNNRSANPQEFHGNRNVNPNRDDNRINRNANELNRDPQEFNRSNRNANPQEIIRSGRNANPQEYIRTNRKASLQDFNRNNRSFNNDEFNRNVTTDEINRNNVTVGPLEFNRSNGNSDQFNQNNRDLCPQGLNRYANPRQFNRNQEPNVDIQNVQGFNRNTNIRGEQQNIRNNASNFVNPRMNYNRGPNIQDFGNNQQTSLDRNSIINQHGNIVENFQLPRDRFHSPDNHPQQQRYVDQDIREVNDNFGGNPEPQANRNYQRIVNNNQITLCRTDWIDANERDLDGGNYMSNERNFIEDPRFVDAENDAIMHDDVFHGHQQDNFKRPDVRNQPISRDNFSDDRNSYVRDRHIDDNRRQLDREPDRHHNLNDDFDQRNNSSRGADTRRLPPRETAAFRGSNNPRFPPNHQYQQTIDRGSGYGNRYRDNQQSGGLNPNRPIGSNIPNADRFAQRNANSVSSNQNRANANHPRTSLDRNMARNINPSGPVHRKPSLERSPRANFIPGGPNHQRLSQDTIQRSNSLTAQKRSSSRNSGGPNQIRPNTSTSLDRSASRNVNAPSQSKPNPNQLQDRKPGALNPNNKKPGVLPNNRAPNQNKTKQPAIRTKNTNPTKNNAVMANPRAGQKREADTAGLGGQNGSKKADPKRQKVDSNRSFIIAGIRLPYIKDESKKLPQKEEDSYAVTFFEQTPIYNTNIYATDDGAIVEEEDDSDISESESLDSNRSEVQSGAKHRNSKKKLRSQLRKEWTKIYRNNNYKDWHNWWRDYKWCGSEINKKLEKYGDRSLRHRFGPSSPKAKSAQVVNQVFKLGHMGLEKNTFSHYRNMRSIFLLMNETFLEKLSKKQMEELQDLIRGIPNHLWLYKIRSMLYLWERYHATLKSPVAKNVHKAKDIQSIAREWKNPVFHWLAKQAFDELKAISEIAWPDHNKIYPGLKDNLIADLLTQITLNFMYNRLYTE